MVVVVVVVFRIGVLFVLRFVVVVVGFFSVVVFIRVMVVVVIVVVVVLFLLVVCVGAMVVVVVAVVFAVAVGLMICVVVVSAGPEIVIERILFSSHFHSLELQSLKRIGNENKKRIKNSVFT